jgi:hypothetical protein
MVLAHVAKQMIPLATIGLIAPDGQEDLGIKATI